ncbi:toprim domain-containing protein (plasmid) [Helicobacter cinaedi]|uniref:toprim domain-containing protein n=1 Tax=Helicobacter cinaedi TaxID=213 RepID=UPI0018A467CC|nr:toprim domain-containing protein [Helicobacter cinaedi]QOQ91978.1 toprim domain-containing protein [Helicobacter cinaedi]
MRAYDFVLLPLPEILEQIGYTIKREKSSQRHITMSSPNGDMIVITRQSNAHYLYFNPFNEHDKGNIHHFCKNRKINIKELLQGKKITQSYELIATELKNNEIQAAINFKSLKSINLSSKNSAVRGNYLRKRGIKEELFTQYNIKIDNRNNVCFPTYIYEKNLNAKDLSLCGYTAKLNQPITKDREGKDYAKALKTLSFGKKGLEILKSHNTKSLKEITFLIITESSIDSLSVLQLQKLEPKHTLLCATGGTITEKTKEAISFLLSSAEKNLQVILAFDNDTQGKKFNAQMKKITQSYEIQTQILIPKNKDFNEDLTQTL